MRCRTAGLVLLSSLLAAVPVLAQEIQGQRPVLLVDGAFQFTPGSWGSYVVHDKNTDEYFTLAMLVLDDETRHGRPGTWLEIDVDTGAERVVTRVLAERTPEGPGELLEAIVQVEGLPPFSVPRKYLGGDDREVGEFQVAQVTGRVEVGPFTHDGESVEGYRVEATDGDGRTTRALVSTAVAPMGLIWADAPEMEILLDDWGGGATSRIRGEPVAMWLWVLDLVSRGMAGEEVSLPERTLERPSIDGTWEERDGACAGTRWMLGTAAGNLQAVTLASSCGSGTVKESVQAATWKTARVATGTLESGTRAGTARLVFLSATRALLTIQTPDGSPATFTVLRRLD